MEKINWDIPVVFKSINERGAVVFSCALIEHLATRIHIVHEMSEEVLAKKMQDRHVFTEESPLLSAFIDVLDYDPAKFRKRVHFNIDELSNKSFKMLRQMKKQAKDKKSLKEMQSALVEVQGLFSKSFKIS